MHRNSPSSQGLHTPQQVAVNRSWTEPKNNALAAVDNPQAQVHAGPYDKMQRFLSESQQQRPYDAIAYVRKEAD